MNTNNTKENAIKLFLDKTNYTRHQIKKIEKKDGFTNISYKIKTDDGQSYQVRLCNSKLIKREVEHKVYNDLEIPLIFFDDKTGNMIRQWVPGKKIHHWNYEKIDLIIQKLKKFHSTVSKDIPKFNAYAFIELLQKNEQDNIFYTQYITLVAKYINDFTIPCHCDLNPGNILYNKQNNEVNIIDFEWSRLANPYFELANLARENMTKKQIVFLAKQYGGINLEKLKEYMIMTCLYAYQWSLSVPNTFRIKKYRKNILKRLKFTSNLNFDNVEKIINNINYVSSNDNSDNNEKNLKFVNLEENVTKKVKFSGISSETQSSSLNHSKKLLEEEKQHNESCKIKGSKKKLKKKNKLDDDFISKEEFDDNELKLQEKIIQSLDKQEKINE